MKFVLLSLCIFLSFVLTSFTARSADDAGYTLLPGDTLQISVWREDLLNTEVIVLPDGNITFPLAGRVAVIGKTTPQVEQELIGLLTEYLAEPVVTVSITAVGGNRVYMLGKVNVPGPYVLDGPTTVAQILSLAGGFDRFANLEEIKILRGTGTNAKYYTFNYDSLIAGEDPEDVTMLLQAGDVIIVP